MRVLSEDCEYAVAESTESTEGAGWDLCELREVVEGEWYGLGLRKKEEVLAAKDEMAGGLGATRGWEKAVSARGVTAD